jgi:hypothetical protein
MDNVNPPMGQGPQEHPPTQPFRFTPGWPGGAQGGPGYGPPPGNPQWQQAAPPPNGPQNPPGPYGPHGPQGPHEAQPPYGPQGPQGPYGQQGPPGPYLAQGPYGPPGTNGPNGPPGPQWQQDAPGSQPPQAKKSWKQEWKRSKRVRWTAGITAAALLGAGGAVGGLALAGSGGSSGSNSASAAALNSAISPSASTSAKCPTPVAGSVHRKTGKHGCLRLTIRRIKGMYGQVAFHASSGTETLAFERGQVVSDSGGVVVVKARNGTEWSWNVASNSLIRQSGRQVSSSQLTSGAKVFVGGQVIGSNKDARLIVIRPQNAAKGSSPSGSSSSNSSSTNSSSNSSSGSAT